MIPVRLTGRHEGLVVLHTRAEWDALIAGVDRQAADAHGAPLEWQDDSDDGDEA